MAGSILQRIAAGETKAVSECLDQYGGLVWSLADRYLKGYGEDLEDASQDVFIEIWAAAGRFDPSKGSEAAFVATIAHRRLIDRRRKIRSRPQLHDEKMLEAKPPVAGPVGAMWGPGDDDVKGAMAAFRELDGDEQRVLYLALHHGLSHERIASVVNLPLGTVKSRIRGGLTRLRAAVFGGGGGRGEVAQ